MRSEPKIFVFWFWGFGGLWFFVFFFGVFGLFWGLCHQQAAILTRTCCRHHCPALACLECSHKAILDVLADVATGADARVVHLLVVDLNRDNACLHPVWVVYDWEELGDLARIGQHGHIAMRRSGTGRRCSDRDPLIAGRRRWNGGRRSHRRSIGVLGREDHADDADVVRAATRRLNRPAIAGFQALDEAIMGDLLEIHPLLPRRRVLAPLGKVLAMPDDRVALRAVCSAAERHARDREVLPDVLAQREDWELQVPILRHRLRRIIDRRRRRTVNQQVAPLDLTIIHNIQQLLHRRGLGDQILGVDDIAHQRHYRHDHVSQLRQRRQIVQEVDQLLLRAACGRHVADELDDGVGDLGNGHLERKERKERKEGRKET